MDIVQAAGKSYPGIRQTRQAGSLNRHRRQSQLIDLRNTGIKACRGGIHVIQLIEARNMDDEIPPVANIVAGILDPAVRLDAG